MAVIFQCLKGQFSARILYRYLAALCFIFWGLIFAAWLGYPAENKYSIMTHTFSFLGSYEEKHSPVWWWLFSMAMLFWSVAGMPLVLYIYRHFVFVSKWGARVGAALLLLGCLNIGLVGIFPDVKTPLGPTLRVTHIHEKVAIFAAAAFILGIVLHGLLLLKDRFFSRDSQFDHRPFVPLYGFWLTILTVASYFLIKWEYVYADMKVAAREAGTSIGSSWSEAMNTIYSFPLWENILIYTLFLFLVCLALILTKAGPAPDTP
ncbi:MAG: hypothetical protein GXY07_17680 [Candidatus Hydrogenedentes bacterium]|nr:hypothetical protein [Candidatus Hydrogenedentota bacterium]